MKAKTFVLPVLLTCGLLWSYLSLVSVEASKEEVQHSAQDDNLQHGDGKATQDEISSVERLATLYVQSFTSPDSDYTQTTATTTTTSQAMNKNVYSVCPSTADLLDCSCTDSEIVIDNAVDTMVRGCMTYLGNNGYTRYKSLVVYRPAHLVLSENILGIVQFDYIDFNHGKLAAVPVDKNFLGASRETVTWIMFDDTIVHNFFPTIVAPVLTEFIILSSSPSDLNILPRGAFNFMPELKFIQINAVTIQVARGVFVPLKKLEELHFYDNTYVHLSFGSFRFTSPHLTEVFVEGYLYPVPGSIEGFPKGSVLSVYNIPDGVQPSVFYNHFSNGARLNIMERTPGNCTCDLAWIRYSPFINQVSIYCNSNAPTAPLNQANLEHCPFFQQLNHGTEL